MLLLPCSVSPSNLQNLEVRRLNTCLLGDGVTASAIQNQMKRIRKEAIILAAARGSVSVSATVAPKGTPRAEPHPTKRGKHSTNKKRKAKDMADSARLD